MSRVLVIGDAMLDIHEFGTSDRLSPEAPVPVIRVHKQEQSFGGAANVAAHIKSAGIPVTFAYKASRNSKSHNDFANLCLENGIDPQPLEITSRFPLTTKHRIWSGKQQICRIDQENIDVPSTEEELIWLKEIANIIDNRRITTVIMSDYNKGTLTDSFIGCIVEYCNTKNIPTILDPKRPTFYTLKGLTIIKPNVRELQSTNLTPEECSKSLGETFLVYTKGKDGMDVYQNKNRLFSYPTEATEVADVCGAGDSVCALLGIALFNNFKIQESVKASNKSAGYTVKHIGCYVLNNKEIRQCLSYAKED
jgi:D-beta-D-heptose 7-phosphate kinase/D-beta-D-heptose 1-phosphate adenosyltransferase